MSSFLVRRAERRDVKSIESLIRFANTEKTDWTPQLEKRFGRHVVADIGRIIDTTAFSAVATNDVGDVIYGFFAASHEPFALENDPSKSTNTSTYLPESYSKMPSWLSWVQQQFECPESMKIANTMFIRFMAVDPLVSLAFTYEVLTALFSSVPRLFYLSYLQPLGVKPFSPFSGPRYAAPGEKINEQKRLDQTDQTSTAQLGRRGSLHLLQTGFFKDIPTHGDYKAHEFKYIPRQLIVPKLRIREARVEDCDDLVPMFKRHGMMEQHATDFHLAQLIESSESHVKTLVAEVSGRAVGFMSLSSSISFDVLAESYFLDPYENLLQAPVTRGQRKKGTVPNFFRSVSLSRSMDQLGRGGSLGQLAGNRSSNSLAMSHQSLTGGQQTSSARGPVILPDTKLTSGMSHHSMNRIASKELTKMSEADLTKISTEKMTGATTAVEEAAAAGKVSNKLREDKQEVNAFCITLFCIEDRFEGMSAEFLRSAFEAYPSKEYCLLTMPTDAPASTLTHSFVKVPHRVEWCPPHCLYILDRYVLDAPVHVRKAVIKDAEAIFELVQDLPNESELVKTLQRCRVDEMNQSTHKHKPTCLVVEAYEQIVGVLVADYINPSAFIEQFDVEDYIDARKLDFDKAPCLLRNLILNPVFQPFSRFVLAEAFRVLKTTSFFYPMEAASRHDLATREIVSSVFVPVRRRRQVLYPNNLRDEKPVDPPYLHALRFYSISLLHEPRLVRNARLVVIGSSDTGLSFVEDLVYTAHLDFRNISLISIDGLTTMEEGSYLTSSLCYNAEEMKQIGFENFIDVIPGTVRNIHREAKQVILTNDQIVPYDFLILAPGLQYSVSSISNELADLSNAIGVNRSNAIDVDNAISECVHSQYWPGAGEIAAIVYGDDLQSFATLQGLLSKGVDATKIALVLPTSKKGLGGAFENVEVETHVHDYLSQHGFKVYRGDITKWTIEDDRLTSIQIKTNTGSSLSIPCQLFLYSHIRSVNAHIFKAINDACLVFDGRLVIDAHFRTHDPYIFSAGPITKFSVRYNTPWVNDKYDSREVGKRLASVLLEYFDPMAMHNDHSDELLTFNDPKKVEALLPGGFQFFNIDRPHLEHDYFDQKSASQQKKEKGTVEALTTRSKPTPTDPNTPETYFRFCLDADGYLQTITYYGTKPVFTTNIASLHGLHERYLNSMLLRYRENIIPDFTEYTIEKWIVPIFYDRFRLFLEQQRREMIQLALRDESFHETKKLLGQMSELSLQSGAVQVPEPERMKFYEAFDRSQDRQVMDESIRHYLAEVLPKP